MELHSFTPENNVYSVDTENFKVSTKYYIFHKK